VKIQRYRLADGEFARESEFNAKTQRREVAKKKIPRLASLRLCVFALKICADEQGGGGFDSTPSELMNLGNGFPGYSLMAHPARIPARTANPVLMDLNPVGMRG
jgi:hypothetical protein